MGIDLQETGGTAMRHLKLDVQPDTGLEKPGGHRQSHQAGDPVALHPRAARSSVHRALYLMR